AETRSLVVLLYAVLKGDTLAGIGSPVTAANRQDVIRAVVRPIDARLAPAATADLVGEVACSRPSARAGSIHPHTSTSLQGKAFVLVCDAVASADRQNLLGAGLRSLDAAHLRAARGVDLLRIAVSRTGRWGR